METRVTRDVAKSRPIVLTRLVRPERRKVCACVITRAFGRINVGRCAPAFREEIARYAIRPFSRGIKRSKRVINCADRKVPALADYRPDFPSEGADRRTDSISTRIPRSGGDCARR